MKILALDTSGDTCSAALLVDTRVQQRLTREPRRHSELILGMVADLLGEAGLRLNQLDALAFGRGPGSFTGVRIATGVVQGLAFGADLPVVPVSTLAALAQARNRDRACERALTALDARMGEVYWGAFALDASGYMRPIGPELVCPAGQVPLPEGDGWQGVGSGWRAYGDVLRGRLGGRLEDVAAETVCESRDIAVLGAADFAAGLGVAPERALPVYLRDQVASIPAARNHD